MSETLLIGAMEQYFVCGTLLCVGSALCRRPRAACADADLWGAVVGEGMHFKRSQSVEKRGM